MSSAEAFFDTDVLLYLLSDGTAKADRAEALLAGGGTVSVQVLNEFSAVARRKLEMPWPEIRDVLATVRAVCAVEAVSAETHDLAAAIADATASRSTTARSSRRRASPTAASSTRRICRTAKRFEA